ncbi:24964_t:CDS:2 [Racocetra persica]|uniref:24964_t:CDS:1 n=1 Tax=Racocetra persica TaxID=160502 RepID=A0ACA9Q506_9GLOM|nr:24964_t:CDS:2 [Racocetra persica]
MRYDKNSTSDENDIYNNFIANKTPALNSKTLAELVGKIIKEGKGTLVRLGSDTLELKESQNEEQKGRSQDETPTSRDANRQEVSDQDLQDLGLTREEFDLLNTAFADEAHIANIIKKLASANPEKVAEMLDRIRSTSEKDKIFEEQVNKNPRYGPPGEDTQDRRDRFEEYAKANDEQKANMQEEENERFTTGENARQ